MIVGTNKGTDHNCMGASQLEGGRWYASPPPEELLERELASSEIAALSVSVSCFSLWSTLCLPVGLSTQPT